MKILSRKDNTIRDFVAEGLPVQDVVVKRLSEEEIFGNMDFVDLGGFHGRG